MTYIADINNADDGWVQVTISGPDVDKLTESAIERALNGLGEATATGATRMTSQAVLDYVAGIAYAVEATRAEQMWLWKDHHRDAGWSWTDERSGYIARVGELDGRPVMISITRSMVQGQSVLFWHPTSVVVDHDMIEAWFRQHMPDMIKIDVDGFHASSAWVRSAD